MTRRCALLGGTIGRLCVEVREVRFCGLKHLAVPFLSDTLSCAIHTAV